MGQAKKEMMRQEELLYEAADIAVEAGVLRRCKYHPDIVWDNHGDRSDAYKLGNARFSRGEVGDFRSRRELTDAIKNAIEQSGDECYLCAKRLAE